MLNAPARSPATPGQDDDLVVGGGSGEAHDQGQVAHQSVVDAEDRGPQRPALPGGAMPALVADAHRRGGGDLLGHGLHAEHAHVEALPDGGVLALVGRDGRHLRALQAFVQRQLVALERPDHRRYGLGAEDPRVGEHGSDTPTRWRDGRDLLTGGLDAMRPDEGVAPFVAGDGLEGVLADRVAFDGRQPLVELHRVALELQMGEAARQL